jgi:hypothetical protein
MQAGPMTMALYEPAATQADEGVQIGTGEKASQHVENRPHELSDGGDPQNSALPELENGEGESGVSSFNAGVLPAAGETITYRRDETGQVVRGDSGRLKAVVPDKTLTFERDETGQIVRGDHLLRRLAQEEDPALRELAEKKRAEEEARAAQQEADRSACWTSKESRKNRRKRPKHNSASEKRPCGANRKKKNASWPSRRGRPRKSAPKSRNASSLKCSARVKSRSWRARRRRRHGSARSPSARNRLMPGAARRSRKPNGAMSRMRARRMRKNRGGGQPRRMK